MPERFSKPAPLAIGAEKADCPNCHAYLFVLAERGEHGQISELACASCGAVTHYGVLLQRVSSRVIERTRGVLAESQGFRRAVRHAQVDDVVRSRIEQYIARAAKDSRIAIALMKGDRLEYRVVNVSYAAIREGGVQYLGRTYRDLFPEAAELGAEEKLREVIETATPWQIIDFKTPIPGRTGLTWWEGECIPIAGDGNGVDSVLVVSWEITDRKLAELATRDPSADA